MRRQLRVQIPCSIWRDDEFTGLSWTAQWLWFALKTSPAGTKPYDPANFINLCTPPMHEGRLYDAEQELRRTKYALAFMPRRNRPTIPDSLRHEVYSRDGYRCLHCKSRRDLSLDHIYPFSLGGEDTYENLQTLCRPCNARKGARV